MLLQNIGTRLTAYGLAVVAAVDSIMWTADTAAAIRAGQLQQHADRLTNELMQVSFEVSTPSPSFIIEMESHCNGSPKRI